MARLDVVVVLALLVAAAWLQAPASGGAAECGVDQVPYGRNCTGSVGECGVDEDEELGLWLGGEGMGEEALWRSKVQRPPADRIISYAALKGDHPPPGKGDEQQRANPYRRGCSASTRCQRNTD